MTAPARQAYRQMVAPTLLGIAASGVSAGGTLLVAARVGAAEFGGYTVVVTIGGVLMIGSLLSLNFVMYQELPRSDVAEHPTLVSTALITSLALAALATAVVLPLSPLLRAALHVDQASLLLCLLFALTWGMQLVTESFLRGQHRFVRAGVLRLTTAVAYVGGAAYFLFVRGITPFGPYVGLLCSSFLVFSALALIGQPFHPGRFSPALAKTMVRHGAALSLTALLLTAAFSLDVVILNHVGPRDAVGQYSIYNGFPKRLLGIVFTEGVGMVLLPILATLDKPRLMRTVGRTAPPLAAGAALLSLAAGTVVFQVLGPDYRYSLTLMTLASAGIGLHTAFNLYYFALSMDGPRGARSVNVALLAGVPLALAGQVLLIDRLGLTGGLWAFMGTNAVLLVAVRVVVVRRYPQTPGGDA